MIVKNNEYSPNKSNKNISKMKSVQQTLFSESNDALDLEKIKDFIKNILELFLYFYIN